MKTESNVLYVLRVSLTLLVICGVVALALAGVNSITAPRIAALKEAAIAAVTGGGDAISFQDDTGLVKSVFASDTGYSIEVSPAGFGGAIDMMVNVSADGKVESISIISHTETSGLGAVAAADTAAGEAFRGQFAGASGTLAVTKDGGTIDSITGATITSRAVTDGVNAALACAATVTTGAPATVDFTDATGLVKAVYASGSGYNVEVAPAGFGGAIDMMVSVSKDGTVNSITILSHAETSGLGAVAAADTAAGEAFRGQFEGASGTLAVTKDGGAIDSITGATITSRAVTDGVNAAIACVAAMG